MIDIYTEAARESGYEPGPENFGYLCRIHVQDTDEKAYESAKGFLTGNVGVGPFTTGSGSKRPTT